nr:hypothetical protein [uncultured Muribaculum sp.]
MTQTFGHRVKIVADFGSSEVVVMVDGVKKNSYKNLSIPEFMQLQNEVEQMAATL